MFRVGAICLVAMAASAGVAAENLMAVYAMARQSDPAFLAARDDFKASGYVEDQALSALLPTAAFEYDKSKTKQKILDNQNTVYQPDSGSTYPTTSRTLTLTQPVYKLSSWRGYDQAKVKVKQAAASLGAAEQDLMMRTANAYLNVLAARDSLEFAEAEKKAIKSQLDLVQQRFASGLVTVVGLHEARARYEVKQSDVVAAQRDLNDQIQALREITGMVLPNVSPVKPRIPMDPPQPTDVEAWVRSAMEKNLTLEGRRLAVDVAAREVARLEAGHLPTVDLTYTNNYKNAGGSLYGGGSVVQTGDLTLRLTIPLYSGGLTTAQVSEALARHQQSLNLQEKDRRQVERQTRIAYEGVTSGIVRIQALAQSVVSQESAYQLKEQGFKSGLQTILGVLDAERDLYSAKRDAAKARYDFLLNRLRLKQAAGTLSEADLAQMDESIQ